MTKQVELLSCPFCGWHKPHLRPGKDGGVNCPHCLAMLPNECDDIDELIGCWNNRTLPQGAFIVTPDDELVRRVAEVLLNERRYKPTAYEPNDKSVCDDTLEIKQAKAVIAALRGEA